MHTICLAFLLSVFGRFLLPRLGGSAKLLSTFTTMVIGALLEAVFEAIRSSHVFIHVWGEG